MHSTRRLQDPRQGASPGQGAHFSSMISSKDPTVMGEPRMSSTCSQGTGDVPGSPGESERHTNDPVHLCTRSKPSLPVGPSARSI